MAPQRTAAERAGVPVRRASILGSLTPMLAAMALDLADLATFGPIGLRLGLAVGAAVGWLLAPALGFSAQRRWLAAAVGGVYCAMPSTAFLPLASVVTMVAKLAGAGHSSESALAESGEEAIEAEYREVEPGDETKG
jgi:hypothetical protein